MSLDKELAIAEQLVRHAGSLTLRMRDDLRISHKPRGLGPVTNADVAVDDLIVQRLAKEFPHDRIISEESCPDTCADIGLGRVWFVDPIDGTASYILGNNDFVVMIGLAIDGIARIGVVYQPATDSLWRAEFDPVGRDTFAETIVAAAKKPLTVEMAEQPKELTLIASRTRRSTRQTEMLKRLLPTHIIYRSSIGLKAMVIAEGGADFYIAWSNSIAMWDTCAPTAILTAAGGHASFIDGTPLNFLGDVNQSQPVLLAHFKPAAQFFDELKDIATM